MYSDGSFTLSYNTVCGKLFTDDSAIIESFTTADGINTVDCVYEIKQPPNKRIVLNILEMNISTQPRIPYRSLRPIRFHHWNHWGLSPFSWPERYNWQDTYSWPFEDDAMLGENRIPSCLTSFLDVYDGPNENAPRLAHLCNAVASSDGLNYYSTQNVMLLKYQSKSWVHSQIHFRANYTTITNSKWNIAGANIRIPRNSKNFVQMITKLQIFVQIYTFMKIIQRMNLNYITKHYNWIYFEYFTYSRILSAFLHPQIFGKCMKIRNLMVVLLCV